MSIIKSIVSILFVLFLSQYTVAQTPNNIQEIGNPQWVAQCGQTGGFGACENLADQHFKGNGVPKDLRMTAYYLLKACRYGNMNMCAFAAKMADEEVQDITIYREAIARLCEFSDAINCSIVWSRFKNPENPYYNPALVGRALETGCNHGSGYVCKLMADWYSDYNKDSNVKTDHNKAFLGHQRTCMSAPTDRNLDREDIKFGCYFSYKYFLGKGGLPINTEQAKEAYLRSCEMADDVETCEIVSSSFYHGNNGMPKDNSASLSMAERACELGSETFCGTAAWFYIEQGDKSKAFSLYAKGCDRKANQYDCNGAAISSYESNGAKAQLTTDYALKACNLGDGWSCFVYGTNTFWLSPNGNKQWFQKACDNGLSEGCEAITRRTEYENNRNNPEYNCPRASCETRTWAEFLRDERETAKLKNQGQGSTFDFGISVPIRANTTPFGSSERNIRNWDNYKENQRCSNPTATGC